jgi:hypothetical protein
MLSCTEIPQPMSPRMHAVLVDIEVEAIVVVGLITDRRSSCVLVSKSLASWSDDITTAQLAIDGEIEQRRNHFCCVLTELADIQKAGANVPF